MTIIEAIILGIIQGLAEFLPISSSGHLAIAKFFFGFENNSISFDVFLHLGTLIAVFAVFYKDVIELIKEFFGICADIIFNFITLVSGKKKPFRKIIRTAYRRFVVLVIVSTIPTAILGVLMKDLVEESGATLLIPGICLLVTAVMLFVSDMLKDGNKTEKNTSWANALFIGVCQGIATMPGISRSGTTITAGLVCGLKRDFVVKYSFLMSIPAILGAVVLEIPDMKEDLTSTPAMCYVVGVIVSAIVGYVCIKAMLVIVKKKKFKYFSYYCAAIGLAAIIGHFVISNK